MGFTESGGCYHGELERPGIFGTKVSFTDLPEACRRRIIEEYEYCWGIRITATPDGCRCVNWEANKDA
jgi:hypothetical protein